MLLPEYLVEYFEVVKYEKRGEDLHLFFEEKNTISEELEGVKVISKGFFDEIIVQDFPIRGQNSFLHIKRRRWLNVESQKVVTRDWNLVTKGTRITAEFASFLKEISRY